MTDDKRKLEPPLKLDMDFGEALKRFVGTKPGEVAESVERSKAKKPPGQDAPTTKTRRKATPSSRTGTTNGS